MNLRPWVQLVLLSCLCLRFAANAEGESGSSSADLSSAELAVKPVGANWTSYNGDYSGRRYSRLAEINAQNAAKLSAQWVFHAQNSNRLEVTPVVVNGIMFVSSANDAFALDARTGRLVWHH